MPRDAAHAYVTVGTVAIVAFLALGVILWSTGGTLPMADGDSNRIGQVVTIPGLPIPPLATVEVGTTITQGVTLTLDATSTGSLTGRTATITLTDPTGRIMTVQRTLALGDTTPYSNYAVTVMAVEPTSAGFFISASAQSCGTRDQQTQLCRGSAACCDGTCQELPSCAGQPNGPVDSCGARSLYCCDGSLSFTACGPTQPPTPTTTSCDTTADCPVISCFAQPCSVNVCEYGTCVERASSGACTTDADCAPISCLTEPCPVNICRDGACIEHQSVDTCETVADCPALECFQSPCATIECRLNHCVEIPPVGGNP